MTILEPRGESREGPVFRFGTVTGASPMKVTLDGPFEEQLASTPVSLMRGLYLGARVQVMIHHGQLIVMGRVGGIPQTQRWGSGNATWANLGSSSASRVLATVTIPAAPYPRWIDVDGILAYQSQTISSGRAFGRLCASVDVNVVASAQVQLPVYQDQYSNYWKIAPVSYRGHLLPANTASTARLWYWNQNSTSITWQFDRGASGETSQIFVTATPV